MTEQPRELLEKTMTSGEVMTLGRCYDDKGNEYWDVDQWDKSGNNRWHRSFSNYDLAMAEFDRWN